MSRKALTLVECGRCGISHQFESAAPDDTARRWGVAAIHEGLDGIGPDDIVDLCPLCLAAMDDWLAGKSKGKT